MAESKPWLSIVVPARNDDYGGDFIQRLENSVHWWQSWNSAIRLKIEFIIVNYNPVPGKASLAESIKWPATDENFTIRIINVPSEIHQQFINPEVRRTVPLFEFIAKNMGIRRASGEFILCTNADILPDPGIFLRLRLRQFSSAKYYRADRADFTGISEYDFMNPLRTLLEIRKNVFRIFLKGYSYDFNPGSFSGYGLFNKRLGNSLKIWKDFKLLKVAKFANKYSIPLLYENLAQKYHLHAAGDFMLMHRENWMKLRGYPENCFSAVHTDALFTIQAATSGLKEKILSPLVYHQHHDRPDSHHKKEDEDFARMYERLLTEGGKMDKENKSILYNEADWGAASQVFEETTLNLNNEPRN